MLPPWPEPVESHRTADGTPLPPDWRYELPARWVLDPTKASHCAVCIRYAQEYPYYERMLTMLDQSFPRHFPRRKRDTQMEIDIYPIPMYEPGSCGNKCSCWIEVKLAEGWKKIVHR